MFELRCFAAITLVSLLMVGPRGASGATAGAGNGPLPPVALSLPADFGLLLGIDAKAVFGSPEYKGLLEGTPMPSAAAGAKNKVGEGITKGLQELEEKTGVSLERDVDRLVMAVGAFDAKEPTVLVIALGRFDVARIAKAIAAANPSQPSLATKTLNGKTVYVSLKNGKPDMELVSLDAGTLAFGTPASLDATLGSQAQGQRSLEANTGLTTLLGGLDPASDLWMVIGPSATAAPRKPGAPPSPVPVPESLTMAGRFGGSLQAVAQMADEAVARNSADMIRSGLAVLRIQMAQDPELARIPALKSWAEGLEITSQGLEIKLSSAGGAGAAAGLVAALAIPSLMRARTSANEAASIGDTRTVISAQAAYESVAGGYGDLACLPAPAKCLKGYTGPAFLDDELANLKDKSGYKRAFQAGRAGSKPRTYQSFAYTATPAEPGKTGTRSFCGDSTGRICVDAAGAALVPVAGACPANCQALR